MKVFISIVSHLHHDVLINLGAIKDLASIKGVEVVCLDNLPVSKLNAYCDKYGAHYHANKEQQGFAANNNTNYLYCKSKLNMQDDDYFVLFNPDIFISKENIQNLLSRLKNKAVLLGAPNLFLDKEEMVHDDNIRTYPKFRHFIKTYLFNDRTTMIDRWEGLPAPQNLWASCSFLIVKSKIYAQLDGLDERYYMYCEDIDFCFRAKKLNFSLEYLEEVKAVHFRHRDSKRFLSKYFLWHVSSVLKYSFTKKAKRARISRLKK